MVLYVSDLRILNSPGFGRLIKSLNVLTFPFREAPPLTAHYLSPPAYVNGDGSLKEAGHRVLNKNKTN